MQCNRAYSVRKPNAMQHQMSMKTAASVFCSRIPKVMAMATAMTEALMLYSAQRHHAKPSSSCLANEKGRCEAVSPWW